MASETTTPAGLADGPDDVAAARFDWRSSLVAGVLFAMSVSTLWVAMKLNPDGSGINTHTQLGLAPCGFVERTGMPCGTCGMTTAYALAADGDLIGSFITQPCGALLALLTAMTAIVSAYAMVRGISLLPVVVWLWRPVTIIGFGAFFIAAWVYKILLMHGMSS